MKTEIDELLTDAADDSAQPLRVSIEDVVRRGRRGVQLRRAGVVAVSGVAAAAAVTGFALWTGTENAGIQPAGVPTSTVTIDVRTGKALADQPPESTYTDAQIITQCKKQDAQFLKHSENKAGGGTDKLDTWKVVLTQGRGKWFRAILASPDGKRRARCQYNFGPGEPREYYDREALGLTKPYEIWSDRDGSWGAIPKKVTRLTFQVEGGPVEEASVRGGYYVWYADLPYTEVRGKSIWAVCYDAQGKELARFDTNPPEGGTAMETPPGTPITK